MNRRGFISALAAIAATATLDPERLLWVPGKRLISIPAPRRSYFWLLTSDGRFWRSDGFNGQAFAVNGVIRIVSDDGGGVTPDPRALGAAISRFKGSSVDRALVSDHSSPP